MLEDIVTELTNILSNNNIEGTITDYTPIVCKDTKPYVFRAYWTNGDKRYKGLIMVPENNILHAEVC